MTTPNSPALGLPTGSAGDLAHADLVGRLAREIYGQGQASSAPFQPHLPQTPQAPQGLETLPSGSGQPALPGATLGTPSVPSGGLPSGVQPDGAALAARSFGAPPVGLAGLTGPSHANPIGATPAPASANFLDV